MFRDPIKEIGDQEIIDDGGGGGIVPPPIDDPPISDITPPIINNLTCNPSTINLSSQNPSAVVTITASVYDFESQITNVHLNGLGATSITISTYTWIKTYYYSSFSDWLQSLSLLL